MNPVVMRNISTLLSDGSEGWFEHAPYDRIIVSAAAPRVPVILRNQLEDEGRFVIPVGERQMQQLYCIVRKGHDFEESGHGPCQFVPLLGEAGWQEGET